MYRLKIYGLKDFRSASRMFYFMSFSQIIPIDMFASFRSLSRIFLRICNDFNFASNGACAFNISPIM